MACYPRQHVTHASTLLMPPRHPRHTRQHVNHASMSPTQARHPRQHEQHAISQTLLDVIPKRKIRKGKQTPTKPLVIQEQNVKALKNKDYASLRMHEIQKLLRYEQSLMSLYLTRVNKLRKAAKHEITNVLEEKLEAPPINLLQFYGICKKNRL